MKISVAAVETLKKKEKQGETKFTTKIGEKLVLVLLHFVKFSFPVKRVMSYYAETCRSRPLMS